LPILELFGLSVVSGTAPIIVGEVSKFAKSLRARFGSGSLPENDEQESLPASSDSKSVDALQKRVETLESSLIDQAEFVSTLAGQGQVHEADLIKLAKRVRLLQFLVALVIAIAIGAYIYA
jgi:hypothetical protein